MLVLILLVFSGLQKTVSVLQARTKGCKVLQRLKLPLFGGGGGFKATQMESHHFGGSQSVETQVAHGEKGIGCSAAWKCCLTFAVKPGSIFAVDPDSDNRFLDA